MLQEGIIFKGSKVLDILPGSGDNRGRKIRLKCKCGKRFVKNYSSIRRDCVKNVVCEDCKKVINRELLKNANKKNPRHLLNSLPEPQFRLCRVCKITDSVDKFVKNRNTCKECYRIESRKRQIKYRKGLNAQ